MLFSIAPFFDIHDSFFRLSVLALVLVVQFILGVVLPGQSHKPPHLFWFAQSLVLALSNKLNRPNRSKSSLKVRGYLAFLFMVLVAWGGARLVEVLSLNVAYGWVAVPFILWGAMNVIQPWRAFRVLIAAKDLKDIGLKSNGLADLTGLAFSKTDNHTTARAALLYAAHSLLRYLVAPAVFYGFFGLLGLFLYVFLTAGIRGLDFGGTGRPFFRWFWAVQNIFDFIPARLTAMAVYAAAFLTPNGAPRQSLTTVFDGSQDFPGIAMGTVLRAFAGAAGVSLGGAMVYRDGEKKLYPWIGPAGGSAKAGVADIKRGFLLHVYASVFVLLSVLGVIISIY